MVFDPQFLIQTSWNPCDFLNDGSDFCSNEATLGGLWWLQDEGWSGERSSHDETLGIFNPAFHSLEKGWVLKMEFMSAMPMWWRLHKVLKVWGLRASTLVNMKRCWDSVTSQKAMDAPCPSHKPCPAASLPFGYSWHWFQYFVVATLFFEILLKCYHLVFWSHSWVNPSVNHDIEQTLIGICSSVGIWVACWQRASAQVLPIAKFHQIYIYIDKTNLSINCSNEVKETWKLN